MQGGTNKDTTYCFVPMRLYNLNQSRGNHVSAILVRGAEQNGQNLQPTLMSSPNKILTLVSKELMMVVLGRELTDPQAKLGCPFILFLLLT
jgi:hypothetical protein